MVAPEVAERLRNTYSVYDLVLRDSAGGLVNLDVCRGKYVVIDLWASWCGPCIANIPALNQLIREYQGKPVQFVSISLDREERDWKKAMRMHPTGGLQLIDADTHGRIVRYNAPQAVDAELKQILDEMMKKAPQ